MERVRGEEVPAISLIMNFISRTVPKIFKTALLIATALWLCIAINARAQFTGFSQQTPPPGPWIAPDEEKANANPIPATKESIERGHVLFHENCEACHGKEGHGDGPSREFIVMNPANLADPKFAASRTDGEWFWKISTGRPPMLAYEDYMEDEDRWNLVNFVRTLSAAEAKSVEMKVEPAKVVPMAATPAPEIVPASSSENIQAKDGGEKHGSSFYLSAFALFFFIVDIFIFLKLVTFWKQK